MPSPNSNIEQCVEDYNRSLQCEEFSIAVTAAESIIDITSNSAEEMEVKFDLLSHAYAMLGNAYQRWGTFKRNTVSAIVDMALEAVGTDKQRIADAGLQEWQIFESSEFRSLGKQNAAIETSKDMFHIMLNHANEHFNRSTQSYGDASNISLFGSGSNYYSNMYNAIRVQLKSGAVNYQRGKYSTASDIWKDALEKTNNLENRARENDITAFVSDGKSLSLEGTIDYLKLKIHYGLALVYREQGKKEKAYCEFGNALDHAKAIGDMHWQINITSQMQKAVSYLQ